MQGSGRSGKTQISLSDENEYVQSCTVWLNFELSDDFGFVFSFRKCNLFKSRRRLRAENLLLRHQLAIAFRRAPPRPRLSRGDRAVMVWIARRCPELLELVQIVQPETILRWHRMGFRAYWRWKSRRRAGHPKTDRGLRDLIRRMCLDNPLWGASRIHGELLKLGFEVAQSTVSKYMVRGRRPPSQSWKTFLGITPMRLPPSICASCQRRRLTFCMRSWSLATDAGSYCGSM